MMKNILALVACMLLVFSAIAQVTIKGKVTNAEDGMGLPGVNVVEKANPSNGVATDIDGNYTLKVADNSSVIVFSSIGMKTIELPASKAGNLVMQADSEMLDEVVVTALGIKKEQKALGYSLTEVKGDEIEKIKQTNAINSLQGKVAGVNITQNSTGAAGSSRVIIRGASSLTGDNQPLYVVDGIPISNENNGSAGMWGGSDGGDGISSINPDDIQSVSVLKGGAASALYGSRAANGVIIITTKTGKNKKGIGVEYSTSVLFDKVNTGIQEVQAEYGQGTFGNRPTTQAQAMSMGTNSWGEKLDGKPTVQWDGVERPYSSVGNNLEHYYRTGKTFINSVALTTGNEDLNTRFSFSDLTNKDIIPNSGLNRKSFSLNSGAKFGKNLTMNANVKYVIERVKNRPRLSDSPGNANYAVATLPANVDVRTMNPGANENGSERGFSDNTYNQNPYFSAYNFKYKDKKNRIIGSGSLRYDFDFFEGLYVSGRAGIDHYTIKRLQVEPWGTRYKTEGTITESELNYTQFDTDLMLGLDKELSDEFAISTFLGANSNTVKNENLYLSGSNFIVPGLEDIGNTENQSRSRYYGKKKTNSLYGSFEVSYNDYAYLTLTGRNDWFSTLSYPEKTSDNSGFYYSVNTSLILSKMFEMPEYVNFLKLRGGYSEVAGGAQDPYQLALTYQIFGQGHQGKSLGGITNNTVPNMSLVPFLKTESEIGVDARLFDNRLSLDIALYKNNTTKDIVPVAASVFSGYSSALANIGEVENKGIEFLISGYPIRNDNFSWNASFNGAYNKGTVISTNEENGEISLGEARTQNVLIKQIVGENFGTIVGTTYQRNENGEILYKIDSNGVPIAQEGDRKILGNGVPPLTLGFSNTFNYKGISLNFLIDGKFGGQIFSGTNTVLYGTGLHKNTLKGRENGLEVSGINVETGEKFTTTVAPENLSIYYDKITNIAEEFVYDADYLKLRQLSIGYSLPEKLLSNTFLSEVNVSFVASNLFYITKDIGNVEPEAAYNVGNAQGIEYFGMPATRSYGFNLNVKF